MRNDRAASRSSVRSAARRQCSASLIYHSCSSCFFEPHHQPVMHPFQLFWSRNQRRHRSKRVKIARHLRGRIICRVWRWLGHRLWRFKCGVAGRIMHRTTRRITFGRRDWIVERLLWSARTRRHEDFLYVGTCLGPAEQAGVNGVTSSDHSFLFKASAVLVAASFTAAFASPVAF
jgi:hypothetical protein